jgi:hypothetical protein
MSVTGRRIELPALPLLMVLLSIVLSTAAVQSAETTSTKGETEVAPAKAKSETAPTKSDAELEALMRKAKVIDPSYKLTIAVSDEQILITTQKKPKASESELKIQSVLLSKIAFDTISSGPQRVKLMFLDFDGDGYSEVMVKRAEVLLFGEGKLSQKDLLSSLEVKSSAALEETTGSAAVAAGPLQPERVMASERIERLKKRGTNVSGFQRLFDQLEGAAKQDQKDEVTKQLADLNRRLKDQEDVLKDLAEQKRSATHKADNSSTSNAMQAYEAWEKLAAPYTSKYPPDMRETSSRIKKELALLSSRGIDCTKGFSRLSEVWGLFSHGFVNEARIRLNNTATQTDAAFRQMNTQEPQSHR